VLALALEAFVLLTPFFMQWVVDGVLVSADRDLLVTLGVGFALLVLLQVATAAARSWAVLVLSATLNLQWLVNVFAHLLRLPVDWFEKRHTGDVWSRFGSVQQIQQTLTTSFIEAVLDGALVLLTLAMMALYSLTLTPSLIGAWPCTRCCAGPSSGRCAKPPKRRWCTSQAGQPLPRIAARRAGDQAVQPQADRQARFMSLVVDTMNAKIATRKLEVLVGWRTAGVRAGARGRGLGRRAAGAGPALFAWACCSPSSPTRSSSRCVSAA
jgi:ATP-binding cassette subfamily B protein RaxB